MSSIKLYFLQASRCIRTAWQLEELGLDYEVKFAPRENGVAPPAFKKEAGGLGKFPSLEDEGIMYYESGNICEYLSDKYDKQHKLLAPPGDPQRYKALQWVHTSEGMFALHGLACLYAKWFQQDGDVQKTQEGMSKNVIKDFDYLQAELEKSSGKFLLGDKLTVADVMMHFSARFIILRELGTMGKRWPKVEEWLDLCEAQPAYQAAVKKTGHQL
ncbi:Glutathione S-transferase 3 [Pseudocercospora fuligena]|uniref:Glutathione S-transferase 3 n=1 Tax=Pseudocercospora fuligena TaxID=685502 RepID=A0A8H6VNJ2_9PEZI|nr:Glutathione S-transferase 3 [Pseudocercospora fuligena]